MIKIGIAGFGKIGRIRAKEIYANKNTELVAVYDLKKPDDLPEHVSFCNSFEALLKHDIEAVFICAYNDVLADFTITALEAGKHVFCEKPPAKTTEALQAVMAAEKKSGLILKYGFNHRFHYSVMEAKKIIDSGKMGKLLWMRGVYGKAGSIDYHKNWRNYRKISGGGILIDQGIHMLDLMLYFSGREFKHINSFVTTRYWDIKAEDNAFIIMQSDDEITAMLHSSATQWRHKFLLEMTFEEGYINLDGLLSATHSYAPEKLIVGMREFEDITFAMGKPKETVTWFEIDNSWKFEIEEFVSAIDNSKKIKNGSSQDGLKVLRLVEDIYQNSGFYSDK
ncbi:MAG: Gfo/Idh/MocA family oxidoreductase [Candidatus Marinimicrobia bacterium]|nr:Gfo/Idh/MocA family oxidoreductase [Candidatus Neomarinimicrobiota bacterium]MCF7922118.1 Gfo/Idh/MocA family oxidoreductase [Candidatus Neomarinimicrobiota bacterium]